tara:strand:+ start:3366 stop:3758 length:393 start_codon:yes stop_codon:yes gene_type:complete
MATGFNNTPPASEFHKHSSWGRTRTPKNILSTHRAGIDASGGAKPLNGATSDVYITENQRYLWVEVTSAAGGATIQVIGIMHAGSTAGSLLQTIDASSQGLHKIEIAGIDKVKFIGSAHANTFYAACSTF